MLHYDGNSPSGLNSDLFSSKYVAPETRWSAPTNQKKVSPFYLFDNLKLYLSDLWVFHAMEEYRKNLENYNSSPDVEY